ncbi:MAG TPA: preprotein translocase subunit YajC [Methylomirabilota bacterium]|nr:preprotein translocase subunit YajC [Methylomirabilota bacterium]
MIQAFMNLVHAAELAYASSAPPGGQGGAGTGAVVTQVVFFAAIFAIFYFLLIRPQQKQKRDRERMLGAVRKGDRVVTTSGLHGTVTGLGEHTITLRVADQVKLEFDRSAIGRVVPEGQADKDA